MVGRRAACFCSKAEPRPPKNVTTYIFQTFFMNHLSLRFNKNIIFIHYISSVVWGGSHKNGARTGMHVLLGRPAVFVGNFEGFLKSRTLRIWFYVNFKERSIAAAVKTCDQDQGYTPGVIRDASICPRVYRAIDVLAMFFVQRSARRRLFEYFSFRTRLASQYKSRTKNIMPVIRFHDSALRNVSESDRRHILFHTERVQPSKVIRNIVFNLWCKNNEASCAQPILIGKISVVSFACHDRGQLAFFA